MQGVVVMLSIAVIINTVSIFYLWRYTRTSEVEVRFLPFEDDHPFLQLISEVDPNEPVLEEQEAQIQTVPEPMPQIRAPEPDYGAWRNQKDIQPWAPNSSVQSSPTQVPRKPLERPPGFV